MGPKPGSQLVAWNSSWPMRPGPYLAGIQWMFLKECYSQQFSQVLFWAILKTKYQLNTFVFFLMSREPGAHTPGVTQALSLSPGV